MRLVLAALFSTTLLASAAPGLAAASAPAVMVQDTVSDTQLEAFNAAMVKVKAVSQAVQGGTPTAEQQAEMAAAISASGLGIEQFNAISTQVSSDEILQARLAVLAAPASPAGSVAAAVTDAEVDQFSATMVKMRTLVPAAGATATAEQRAAMAAAVTESGLTPERFNAISTAVSQDERLRARVELADLRRG